MLLDESLDAGRKSVFSGKIKTVLNMRCDDTNAGYGVELFVHVLAGNLIFNEKLGAHGLTDVVVKRSNSGEQRSGAYCACSLLGEVCNLEAVLITPR